MTVPFDPTAGSAPAGFAFNDAPPPEALTSGTVPLDPGEDTLTAPGSIPERQAVPILPPFIDITDERKAQLKIYVDQYIHELEAANAPKQMEYAEWEEAYRARQEGKKSFPFEGACNDQVPVIAMAVDPITARLETGIFKQDPVFRLKPLKKSAMEYNTALERWIEYYTRNIDNLRRTSAPRILECAKLGTMVFKVIYDKEERQVKGYDEQGKVVDKVITVHKGPRVLGVSLGDFLFPARYQHVQDCPLVAERKRTTIGRLRQAARDGKIDKEAVEKIAAGTLANITTLETARQAASNITQVTRQRQDEVVVHEIYCEFDVKGDGKLQQLAIEYVKDQNLFLAIRYNWYFHQRKPYVVIPYTVTNESLTGIGICEMSLPFQQAITRWQQMSSDNAYIANIRMFIAKKESGIEEVPRLYAGKVFYVSDPKNDLMPFSAGEIYPSTLSERQNLFGLLEKRTGVSDYLTGRESPIVGSRATATSTVALIQEGTKRVEQVLDNFRQGYAEILQFMFYIWFQYGTDGLEDAIFGDDDTGRLVKEFFQTVQPEQINGSFAIDLSATDASGNRSVMQQMQLSIIQTMMGYLEKVLQMGQQALMANAQGMPQYTMMVAEVMAAARNMFKELLQKYDIRNPEDYLPDLEKFLNGGQQPTQGQGVGGLPPGQLGSDGGVGSVQAPPQMPLGAPGGGAGSPGGGNIGPSFIRSLLGQGAGV